MKQLIIGKDVAYASSANGFDLTTVPEGAIAIFTPSDGKVVSTDITKVAENVAIACGRGKNKMPIFFPEVDVNSLTVAKSSYQEGKKFIATITVPTTEKGMEYTVIVAKVGTVFNERNKWSFDALAKSDVAADVASEIEKKINANSHTLGVTAKATGGNIVITATEDGPDYEVFGAEGLMGVEPTNVTHGAKAVLDKAFVQDLASRCAAGKGFNDTYRDGDSIYPGYPEVVDADQYVMYTLRFAVPRLAAKQRDEVVYQRVHIVVPVGAACIATLDTIFGTSDASGASVASIADEYKD